MEKNMTTYKITYNCQNCWDKDNCFADPSECVKNQLKAICRNKDCKHILVSSILGYICPNPDCFYFYFFQDREITPEREIEIIEEKWKERRKK
jgi:hypothetical protein